MNSIYVRIVIDRSGSMAWNKGPTIAAVNSYIAQLPDDAVITVSLFDSEGMPVIRSGVRKLQAVIHSEEYLCRGGTPLYDAVGAALVETDDAAKDFERVVLVVQTDGAENQSKEWTADRVKAMVQDKQSEGWLIVFLGADQDAWANARNLGFDQRNTMAYASGVVGQTMNSLSRATMDYSSAPNRAQGLASSGFTNAERQEALGKK